MKWIFIITVLVLTLGLNGCADTSDAEDSTAITPVDNQEATDSSTDSSGGATVWIAIVMTWQPVNRTIDKEFTSEGACWNYYENGVGEGKFGEQHRDHQDNLPTKDFHFGPDYLEYPIRTYRGINDEQGSVWLTCDIKSRYEDL